MLCHTSCSAANGGLDVDDVFSQLIISESETDEPAFAQHIYIIIPNGCSGELSLKARELADGVESKTGILTSLKYDNELTVVPNNSCEILLGHTNRLVSDNALEILRDGEYLCRWEDGALVICGRSDSSTVIAVDRFINEILPISSKYSLMPEAAHFELRTQYEIERITLNGYDLYDYVFIYPDKNENAEKDAALIVRDFINSQSGYFLDVISESEVTSKTVRAIKLLGSSDKNTISPIASGISLNGTDAYALSCVAARFIEDIRSKSDTSVSGALDLSYENNLEFNFDDTTFESVFWFSKANEQEPFRTNFEIISYLRNENVGICIVGNPNKNLKADLELNIKAPIKLQEALLGDRTIMVIYDESKIKSVDIAANNINNANNTNEEYLTVEVDTLFGERMTFIYAIEQGANLEIERSARNTIIFYENCENIQYEGVLCADNGEFKAINDGGEVKDMSYSIVYDANLRLQNTDSIVSSNENKHFFALKTKILQTEALLKYALK